MNRRPATHTPGLTLLLAILAMLFVTKAGFTATPAGIVDSGRRQIFLSDGWLVKQLDTDKADIAALTRESASPDKMWMTARMPAQVHDVLLAHGLIPDPHIGTNAAASAWVGEKGWAYVCRFPTPRSMSGHEFLRLEGLDTLADAWLNGTPRGHFENMFREYAVPVKDRLAAAGQTNVLVMVFSSPLRYQQAARLPPGDPNAAPHKSLRKCHSDFSSYLGARPHAVKVGVYRDVVLDLPEQSWIEDVWVRLTLQKDLRSAMVRVRVETGGSQAASRWVLTDPTGREVRQGECRASGLASEFAIAVQEPLLWWPRMSGPQTLYTFDVNLVAGERVLDRRRTQFGIREVKPVLKDPATGEHRFRFDVNGQPIFLRGGNWVPLEGATHVWQPERARQLLDLAEHGNMNMLRIWGEGVLPPQSFYEECDRRGICLWQDFMFGYYDHTKGDTTFLDNCRAEIEGSIRRLRNHPSVLLWCGGNEQYLWTPTAIVTDADVFVSIETDAGIVGYGDATNNFLPSTVEGALKDMIPYLMNPEALKRLREHTDVPLAIGERYHSKWECREAVINQWVDYQRPDVCHCGGITEMMRIAGLADVFYITLIPHNNAGPLGSAATLHAALAIPNLTMIEAPWANGDAQGDVVKPFPTVENGYALPLDGPGLGVTFDEERAKAKPFRKPPLQPRLNATDGSVRDF